MTFQKVFFLIQVIFLFYRILSGFIKENGNKKRTFAAIFVGLEQRFA